MTALNKQALREAANAANIASWGKWESYKPHKGARGYEVRVGAKAVAQHCLKVDSAFIAAANPSTFLALLDENLQLQRDKDSLEAVAIAMRDDMRDAREKLEAAEKRIEEEICRANREHHRGFMMACNHLKEHANVHYADAAEMEIAALRQRIAELEANKGKPVMFIDGDISASDAEKLAAVIREWDDAPATVAPEEMEARTVTLPDVEKWRSVDAVRAQNAYKVLVSKVLTASGILVIEGEGQ